MIHSREEFKRIARTIRDDPTIIDERSRFWVAEQDITDKCHWFVSVPCLRLSVDDTKTDYWVWCADVLKGYVRCFMIDYERNEEWWGFTDEEDATIWTLKWSG